MSVFLDTLLSRNIITVEQAEQVEDYSAQTGKTAVEILLSEGTIPEHTMFAAIADELGLPFVDLEALQVDAGAASSITAEWARKLKALPIATEENKLIVAFDRPSKLTAMDDLRRLTGRDIVSVIAAPTALKRKIDEVYRSEAELENLTSEIEHEEGILDHTGDEEEDVDEIPIVKYVNLVLAQAISDRASDVHIEPTETEALVRFRIDGVLHNQTSSPRTILAPVVSRVKVMANMDIAEKRVPQDGRMTLKVGGRRVDLRVVTLPTVYGEKLVLRILDNDSTPTNLSDVGMSERNQKVYETQYTQPYGMILVTGPTGSGKSTTLYTTLGKVKRPEINVITVEDPVELRVAGVNQVQINVKAKLTFATALKSILRSDPDVILIGEIRDRETAQIAVEAALTGHLVLSTLHTNDAPSAVTRLVEMGTEPFLVSSALNLVVAQRLLRRLCTRCPETYTPDVETLEAIGYPYNPEEPLPEFKRPTGCPHCSTTGYRGRTAIHELLVIDSVIERMVNERAHTNTIRDYAIENGNMVPMKLDGWEKVAAGITTIDEVLRVSA